MNIATSMNDTISQCAQGQRGFTMVELLVALSVLGVLLSIAAPSFVPIIERWRVRQAAEGLQSSLHYARSEALKRGGNVVLAPEACPSGSCGWMIFWDKDGNGSHGGQDEILRVIPPTTRTDITLRSGANVPFNRWGLPDSAGVQFVVAPANGNMANSSMVCLRAGGLVQRLEQRGSTSPISC